MHTRHRHWRSVLCRCVPTVCRFKRAHILHGARVSGKADVSATAARACTRQKRVDLRNLFSPRTSSFRAMEAHKTQTGASSERHAEDGQRADHLRQRHGRAAAHTGDSFRVDARICSPSLKFSPSSLPPLLLSPSPPHLCSSPPLATHKPPLPLDPSPRRPGSRQPRGHGAPR